ncbi:flagellar hook-basal body complex protein FliE [Agarivorans sp. MS3-6]|uniref:flagellar hook-basal body complex protein FliE n=1 Tax=Agarivorans sp. TSD2052 TaxID=2937286 RepID=UPI00200F36AE|nr:flagellar hook-basal body complex protein FliE [Agarivorans sp. TSD2052]UPW20007.1 flagellar hook-basal body complex protein FliE [Agarivorans sp. TSD2052]
MRIESANLFSELQSMAGEMKPAGIAQDIGQANSPLGVSKVNSDFGSLLSDAINNVNSHQSKANELRTRFDLGDHSVSIGDVMIAAQKSSVAFDATVQVRNKFVDAYKEIMSMPV